MRLPVVNQEDVHHRDIPLVFFGMEHFHQQTSGKDDEYYSTLVNQPLMSELKRGE
jgi:hypothetical protein